MSAFTLRQQAIAQWGAENPELDTSPMEVVAQVKRIVALLEVAIEAVYLGAALTAAEMELLVPLRHSDQPVTAIRLAERLGMSRAGVSKTLANVERRGMIVRTPNPANRRSVLIMLSEKGIQAVDDIFPRELEAHGRLLGELGADRTTIVDALNRLAESMEIASVRSG